MGMEGAYYRELLASAGMEAGIQKPRLGAFEGRRHDFPIDPQTYYTSTVESVEGCQRISYVSHSAIDNR